MASTTESPPVKKMKQTFLGGSTSYSVIKELQILLDKIPTTHSMFGDITPGLLKLPKSSNDGRELTWEKWIHARVSDIINKPRSIDDCWFIPANKEDGTHQTKFSTSGGSNKFQTARVMHMLLNPDVHNIIENKEIGGDAPHFAHRCGKGMAVKQGNRIVCCINPYHIVVVPAKVNQDHKGCKYGCQFLCPHDPKCIYTWFDTGYVKPCFMSKEGLPIQCEHIPKCKHIIENM